MIDRLYYEKYRPSELKGMILLPRIRKVVMNAEGNLQVPTNLLLTGGPGTGKTTLARIIRSKHETLSINASLKSSVDDLKGEVHEFCQTMNIFGGDYDTEMKVVFLDEFDGVSAKFQEGLRGFIEEYESRVRFVATVNNISKIIGPVQSRFSVINFDPKTAMERQLLETGYTRRAMAVCKKLEMDITEEDLLSIVRTSFPDYRSVFNAIQIRHASGAPEEDEVMGGDPNALYDIVCSAASEEHIYDYVMSTWGDKVDGLVKMMGRPFAQWIFQNKPDRTGFVAQMIPKVREYEIGLREAIDPAVHAMALIYEAQTLYKS